MTKPVRALGTPRAPLARKVWPKPRSNWVPVNPYSDLGEVMFDITVSMTATYPDTDPTATFDISVLLSGDIGITQIVGGTLEDSRAPYNPATSESRV